MSRLHLRVLHIDKDSRYPSPILGIDPDSIIPEPDTKLGILLPGYDHHVELTLGQWFQINNKRFNIGRGYDIAEGVENHLVINHQRISGTNHLAIMTQRNYYRLEVIDEYGRLKGRNGTTLCGNEMEDDSDLKTTAGEIRLAGDTCIMEFKVKDGTEPLLPVESIFTKENLILSNDQRAWLVGKEDKRVSLSDVEYKFLHHLMSVHPKSSSHEDLYAAIYPGVPPVNVSSNLNTTKNRVANRLSVIDPDHVYIQSSVRRTYRLKKESLK